MPKFPPMKIGGPIEATRPASSATGRVVFPPMKIGGPIEAGSLNVRVAKKIAISADENRRPH